MSANDTHTAETWDRIDAAGNKAEHWFNRKRGEIERPENFGRYVAIDSDTGEFEIGADELEAERRFIAKYGVERNAVLIHIGRY